MNIPSVGGKNMAPAAEAEWSWIEEKIFEDALVKFPEGVADRWEKISGCLPGKSVEDVKDHYDALLFDISLIDDGIVEVSYPELTITATGDGRRSLKSARKKGRPWTEEEHMLFLCGVKHYGPSDWRSISRHAVKTRQPSQVASHAQKFFNRQKSPKKTRKRSSIHDITTFPDDVFERFLKTININYPNPNDNGDNGDNGATVASNPNLYINDNGDNGAILASNPNLYINDNSDNGAILASNPNFYINDNGDNFASNPNFYINDNGDNGAILASNPNFYINDSGDNGAIVASNPNFYINDNGDNGAIVASNPNLYINDNGDNGAIFASNQNLYIPDNGFLPNVYLYNGDDDNNVAASNSDFYINTHTLASTSNSDFYKNNAHAFASTSNSDFCMDNNAHALASTSSSSSDFYMDNNAHAFASTSNSDFYMDTTNTINTFASMDFYNADDANIAAANSDIYFNNTTNTAALALPVPEAVHAPANINPPHTHTHELEA